MLSWPADHDDFLSLSSIASTARCLSRSAPHVPDGKAGDEPDMLRLPHERNHLVAHVRQSERIILPNHKKPLIQITHENMHISSRGINSGPYCLDAVCRGLHSRIVRIGRRTANVRVQIQFCSTLQVMTLTTHNINQILHSADNLRVEQ